METYLKIFGTTSPTHMLIKAEEFESENCDIVPYRRSKRLIFTYESVLRNTEILKSYDSE